MKFKVCRINALGNSHEKTGIANNANAGKMYVIKSNPKPNVLKAKSVCK